MKETLSAKQKKIIGHYGLDHQLNILMEESAELIVAISKNKRYEQIEAPFYHYENLIEEMADVKNLIEQIELEYPHIKESMEVMISHKVDRQLERMEVE